MNANNRTLPGFVFNYAYDDIGNLKAEKRGGNVFEYFANNLNQYTRRTVPGAVDVMGSAADGSKIAIQRGSSALERLSLLNGYFSKTYVFNNTSSARPIQIFGLEILGDAGGMFECGKYVLEGGVR